MPVLPFLADNFSQYGKIEIEIKRARPPGGLFPLFRSQSCRLIHRDPAQKRLIICFRKSLQQRQLQVDPMK
jgi:hypothetical protein